MKFIWIDDNPEREISSKNLGNHIGIECQFIDVENKDVGDVLKDLLQQEEPDLIIIDHNLTESVTSTEFPNLVKKGSSAASIIRQQWKECPIICISAANVHEVDSQEKNIYEEIYPINDISKYYSEIYSIATSFKALKNNKPDDIHSILQLLKCPEVDEEKLKAIIPKNIKENFHDGGLIVEISNWVRGKLIARPGFLYDKLWSATLLGLNIDGFEKVMNIFEGAKYAGVFSNEENPRWWKSDLIKIISQKVPSPGLPSYRIRFLEEVEEKDYSQCYVTKEPFPETVAFIDDTREAEQVPIKLKVTMPHEGYEKLLYFEDIRLMAPAQ